MKNIQIKPGDIVVMNNRTRNGVGIKVATVSSFTHVAFAITHDKLLESTLDRENPTKELREITVSEALKDTRSVTVYLRENALTKEQLSKVRAKFEEMRKDPSQMRYAKEKAFASAMPRIIRTYTICILLYVAYGYFEYGLDFWLPSIGFAFLGFLGIPLAQLLSRWLSKTYPSNWLTQPIQGTFCSSFVASIENTLESPLNKHIGKWNEPRPKDIAKSCKKTGMKWVQYHF
ncbi:TPA: hypothetical protein ACVU4C_004516 [Vibrio parahaemolyticus]|uniref:hypothetical protein n=2 Tax=Vibrio parahaemolyticus TaxID=670 RepID=UPI001120D68C|nr:hypothetical protein [Vibrio parahaemolyticus]EHH2484523.1 hypothetical protein [Vibrio parahaemolyticus]ELY2121235.1 hypothetical protein [Vibrio parahaemolyticus]MBE3924328.1 hypothetical protein [Vibrio parahaemolyticus]TOP98663.1 hypothetical protein CGH05_21010 [Vibrio parahaemolyticus]WMN69445.1 hypothetical protein NI387_06645 [Vibrio parahaemolyticus]